MLTHILHTKHLPIPPTLMYEVYVPGVKKKPQLVPALHDFPFQKYVHSVDRWGRAD